VGKQTWHCCHMAHPTLPKDGLPIATAYTLATSMNVLKNSLQCTAPLYKYKTLSSIMTQADASCQLLCAQQPQLAHQPKDCALVTSVPGTKHASAVVPTDSPGFSPTCTMMG
jgi:hypothetical protein